jgi:hypothetical protein
VGPRAGLDTVEKKIPSPCRDSNPRTSDRPAPSQSLYRLSHPGSFILLLLVSDVFLTSYSFTFFERIAHKAVTRSFIVKTLRRICWLKLVGNKNTSDVCFASKFEFSLEYEALFL